MGTNCAPLLAKSFLYSYEAEFIQKLLHELTSCCGFQVNSHIYRRCFIDQQRSVPFICRLYIPTELEIKDTSESSTASYLDVLLNINAGGKLTTQL
jgi:hypothetical protein